MLRPGDEVVAVPAIATEGIALYDAVVAQGIAGVLARQRDEPLPAGVRSRLWRFVAATRGGPGARATRALTAPRQRLRLTRRRRPRPVLALFSRLPLDDG